MGDEWAIELVTDVDHPQFRCKVNVVGLTSGLQEGIIEFITIEGSNHSRFISLYYSSKSHDQILFIVLIVDSHMTGEIILRGILKFMNSLSTELAIINQHCLALEHQRHHHHLVLLRIRKFQRLLWSLNIVCQYFYIWNWLQFLIFPNALYELILYLEIEPYSCSNLHVDANPRVEGHIILLYAENQVTHLGDWIFILFSEVQIC